jgi:hypothetical protein
MYWKFEIETFAGDRNDPLVAFHRSTSEDCHEWFRWYDLHLFKGRLMLSFARRVPAPEDACIPSDRLITSEQLIEAMKQRDEDLARVAEVEKEVVE